MRRKKSFHVRTRRKEYILSEKGKKERETRRKKEKEAEGKK